MMNPFKPKDIESTLERLNQNDEHIAGRSLWQDAMARFRKNRLAMFSLFLLIIIALVCFVMPFFLPYHYAEVHFEDANQGPSATYWFGTDSSGRDLFVRTLVGGRISLMVGLVGSIVSLLIGVTWGAVAGFIGGKTDLFMMRVVDMLYSLPIMFVIILVMILFDNNIFMMFIAIGAVSWLAMARIVRGQTLSLKRREFIEAAHAIGADNSRIILLHIVPNLIGTVIVYTTLTIPTVILFESMLSFLGLGIAEPMTSWGVLISEGTKVMEVYPWYLAFPSLFLTATLFCMNFIGDGLRDALDPKTAEARDTMTRDTMNQPLLKVKDLHIRFHLTDGEVKAVNGVNFDLNKSESLGIVGESGSGKTQLILALMGLTAPNGRVEGSIQFEAKNLSA